jgi:transposase
MTGSLLRPTLAAEETTALKVIYRRCAGLDVHEKSVFVCARIVENKKVEVLEATFPTFTEDLEELKAWLKRHRIKRVAMESTGVYWRPIWNVLEQPPGKLELLLLNPKHVKALPGHKTDRVDAARIAELLQYGLVRSSFVPPVDIRELRDLVRRRVNAQQDRTRIINRIHRLLETANIKLSSVLSQVTGVTGRKLLDGLATATLIRPESLLILVKHKKLEAKKDLLRKALRCHPTDHFRFLLRDLLEELDRLEGKVLLLETRIDERMRPHRDLIERLKDIPGVDRITAWTLISEIGLDMSRFPTSGHLASWAGLCPGNSESAGKRHSGRTNKGNRFLRRALTQSAWAAVKSSRKPTFLTAVFHRIARRAGLKKAAIAVAHRLLTLVYCMIRDGSRYRELGSDYFDRINPTRTVNKLIQRFDRLGFSVQIEPKIIPKPT